MNSDINLLSNVDTGLQRQKKWEKVLRILSFLSLIFVGLSSIIVFLLSQQFSLSSITKEQQLVLQKISNLRKKEAKLLVINNRLRGIFDILNKRLDYSKTTNSILQKVPSEVMIEKLAIDNNKVFLTASSDSLLSINNLIDSLIDMAKKKETITFIVLNSLSLSEKTSRYLINLEAAF